MKRVDMIGRRFGRLTVLRIGSTISSNKSKWYLCRCDCGTEREFPGDKMRLGTTRSCGCLRSELTRSRTVTHGLTNHRLFPVWKSIMSRCYNINNKAFKSYGNRGIRVCHRWHDVAAFIADNEHLAAPGLSIDRVDNSKGYSIDNTRWATRVEQATNRRSNVLLTHDGKTQTLFQWAREVGLKPSTLWARIRRRKWTVEAAITTPATSTKNQRSRATKM